MLKTSLRLIALGCGSALLAAPSLASTRVGIYAIIDDVKLEPSDREPDRAWISGTFVVPTAVSSGEHGAPTHGHLYLSVNPDATVSTRNDWEALRKAAGTGKVVGFGQYWMSCTRSRMSYVRLEDAPKDANCSFEVDVQSDYTRAVAAPYPAPSSEGVVAVFDSQDDLCPRFGRSSGQIVAELRQAHGGARTEPPVCKDWVGLVGSSELERTFGTQARNAEWADVTETLLLRRLTQAQGLQLLELGVECRDTISHIRLAYPI